MFLEFKKLFWERKLREVVVSVFILVDGKVVVVGDVVGYVYFF